MDNKEFYGGSAILSLTSRKALPIAQRVILVKSGSTNGLNLPPVEKMYKKGAPLWYVVNGDVVALNIYSHDDILEKTIPVGQCAIIGLTGGKYDIMVRDKSQSDYFTFDTTPLSISIFESQENFILRDYVNSVTGYDGTVPLILTATIESGVIIGGTTPLETAFDTGTWPSGTVIHLHNNGEILGAGGGIEAYTQFPGGGEGGRGGDAIRLQAPLVLYNVNGRIASGGGQGSRYLADGASTFTSGNTGQGGGQGYVGGWGDGDNNSGAYTKDLQPNQYGFDGSPAAPGTCREGKFDETFQTWGQPVGPNDLFNTQYRMLYSFGNGGWLGCPGEEFAYYASDLINNYGSANDKNTNGDLKSYYAGGPGRSILNAELLTISSLGQITGPSADFVNNAYVWYLMEPYAMNVIVGKTIKKIGWDGVTAPNVTLHIGINTTVGHWAHYQFHMKSEFANPAHGFTVDGHHRVQPNSVLFESDWPVGTVLNLENNGRILGGGGNGKMQYDGTQNFTAEQFLSGASGGNAIATFYNLTIDNQGQIAGGGGGGGCKQQLINGSTTYFGYSVPTYSFSSKFKTGSGGSGVGFAYGPYVRNSYDIRGATDDTRWAEFSPLAGQKGDLVTPGRAGVGASSFTGTGNNYRETYPWADAGAIIETQEVWDEDLMDYVDESVQHVTSTWGETEGTAWFESYKTSPWPIASSWYLQSPGNTASGGALAQTGNDGGTSLENLVDQFGTTIYGGPNQAPGQPGYYMYGNSFVTWTNTGTRNGLVGG